MPERPPVKITDPRTIRALAHPARLAVIEELYAGRELTATECAEVAGLTPSAMSYHLRSLEKAGIVERADPTGDARERPWRAAGGSLQVESHSYLAEATDVVRALLARLGEQFDQWDAHIADKPRDWQDASMVRSASLWLSPAELVQLHEAFEERLAQLRERTPRPDGARRVRVALFAVPMSDERRVSDESLDEKEDPAP